MVAKIRDVQVLNNAWTRPPALHIPPSLGKLCNLLARCFLHRQTGVRVRSLQHDTASSFKTWQVPWRIDWDPRRHYISCILMLLLEGSPDASRTLLANSQFRPLLFAPSPLVIHPNQLERIEYKAPDWKEM